jgi:hypothetical protein
MIGRRGRFIALAGAMGFFLCAQLAAWAFGAWVFS